MGLGLAGGESATPAFLTRSSDRAERRAFARSTTEWVKLTFRGLDHRALNWSAGGVLIEDRHPALCVGSAVSGITRWRTISVAVPILSMVAQVRSAVSR